MTENAGIARLWQGFHHLSESDKDLVLAVAETVGHFALDTQARQDQSGAFYNGEPCHNVIKDRTLTPVGGTESDEKRSFK